MDLQKQASVQSENESCAEDYAKGCLFREGMLLSVFGWGDLLRGLVATVMVVFRIRRDGLGLGCIRWGEGEDRFASAVQ